MPVTRILSVALLGAGLAIVSGDTARADRQLFNEPLPIQSVSKHDGERPLLMAQSSDAAIRVNRLEEQIRALNGRIEDLNFQLLQMQEELRRMQEDNELRFQELESKRGGSGTSRVTRRQEEQQPGKSQPSEREQTARSSDGDSIARVLDGGTIDGTTEGSEEKGLEPRTLGTLTFDENGNLINSEIEKPIDLTGRGNGGNRIAEVAPKAPSTVAGGGLPEDPAQLYDLGYGYVQSGEYEQAEQVFGEFIARHQDHERLPEARFWLGESLFAQGQYEEAARIFLDTHKQYPDGRMAPQTLLKLGVSLAGMDQRELACATFAEVPKKYPEMSNAVRTTLATEQKAASCMVN